MGCLTAAAALRRQRVALPRPAAELQVEQRSLADYDAALGLDVETVEGGVA